MSMYCRDEKGTVLERKYRSLVLRSTDRGKTWLYLSTIAFDMTENVRGEGFDETSLLVLPDGKILSFIRSGASYQASMGSFNNNDPSVEMPFGYSKQTPIYMSASIDGGRNWSSPDPISPYGVWPNAVLMENGLLVVSYGRPGNWMMFSKDEGKVGALSSPFTMASIRPIAAIIFPWRRWLRISCWWCMRAPIPTTIGKVNLWVRTST